MSAFNIDNSKGYRRSLTTLATVLAFLFFILVAVSYEQLRQYTISQHSERLNDFLALNKAMHQYIETEQKPVFTS
jgi:hypothetical protein